MWARAPGKDRGDNSPGGKKLIVYSNRAVADNLRTQIQKLKDKIEAAKKLVEKGPNPDNTGEDYQRSLDDWLGKLMNILEAEG